MGFSRFAFLKTVSTSLVLEEENPPLPTSMCFPGMLVSLWN